MLNDPEFDDDLDGLDDDIEDDVEDDYYLDFSSSMFNYLDERFEEAARYVVISQRASTSDLQRRLGMGYVKASRVMDQLEVAGIVGSKDGSKPRQVLVRDLNELNIIFSLLIPGYNPSIDRIEPTETAGSFGHYTSPVLIAELPREGGNPSESDRNAAPQYSDSVNAMNGCLGAVGQVFAYTMVILLLLCTAPAIIMILLFWWIIAWILGLIFPGKEFFPIKKIWDSVSRWTKEKLNVDLGSAAIAAGIIMVLTAIFGGGSSKKD